MKKLAILAFVLISLVLFVPLTQVQAATDKVGTITITAQTPDIIEPGNSVAYTVTVERPSKSPSTSGSFEATLIIIGNLPEGVIATFDPATVSFKSKDNVKESTLSITTTPETLAGIYEFTVQATRNESPLDFNSNTATITIDNPPVLATIGNQFVNELTLLEFDSEATDIDSPPQTLTYSIVGKPDYANFDANTGVFSWTPNEMQDEIYMFDIIVSDGLLTDFETITVTVNEVNEAPTLNPISIAETQIAVGEPVTFTATASDDDYVLGVPNTLTFSLEDGTSGLVPTGASITNAGDFTWTPSSIQYPGSYTFDVVVNDNYLPDPKTASETITIDVLYNVRTGENVNVIVDPDVTLTFNLVNERGITTAESSIDPELFGLYPLSGIIGEYYDITVETAFFESSAGVIVAIHYDDTGLNKKQEAELRLFTSDGEPVEGDFNGDGIVDVKDQTELTNAISSNSQAHDIIELYNVNGDEFLNQEDLEYFKVNFLGNTSWTDITTEIDTVNNIIYGFTGHFSGFGVRR